MSTIDPGIIAYTSCCNTLIYEIDLHFERHSFSRRQHLVRWSVNKQMVGNPVSAETKIERKGKKHQNF